VSESEKRVLRRRVEPNRKLGKQFVRFIKFIKAVKLRRITWAGHVAKILET
jgi:hypothetical protein